MKKIYEKPEVDFICFELNEVITDEDGKVPGLSGGDEGYEEW